MKPAVMEAGSGPLESLTKVLGDDVFFVPCEWGTKKSLVTYVERPFEGMNSPHLSEVELPRQSSPGGA